MGDRFDRSRSRPGRMTGRDRRHMPAMFDEGGYYSSSEYTIDPRGRGGGRRPPPQPQGRVPNNGHCNDLFCNIDHRGARGVRGGRGPRGYPPPPPPYQDSDTDDSRDDNPPFPINYRGGRGPRGYPPPPPPYQDSDTDDDGRCNDPRCPIDHRGDRGRGPRGRDIGRGPFPINQGRGGYMSYSDEENDYYLSDDEPCGQPARPRGPQRRPQGPARRPQGRGPGRRGGPGLDRSW